MKITWVDPGFLAASSIPISDENLHSLHGQGIRAILSLTEKPLTSLRTITPETIAALKLHLYHVPVPDHHAPTLAQADVILSLLGNARHTVRPVLVHCHAGVGRTGTILHLYFLAQGLTLAEARVAVRRVRPQSTLLSAAQEAFLDQLVTLEEPSSARMSLRVSTLHGWVELDAQMVDALGLQSGEPISARAFQRRLDALNVTPKIAALYALLDQGDDLDQIMPHPVQG